METVYWLDLSGQDQTKLDTGIFFDNPYLVELDVSGNQLFYIPTEISNCPLLRHVDLSGNPMNRPPAVLFTIPWLRAHPENIIYGNGQVCTRELATSILADVAKLGQCLFRMTDLEGRRRKISVTAGTTSHDFFCLAHPRLAHLVSYVFIVRKYKGTVLRFMPENVPIGLYMMEGAEWSFELKFLPSDLPVSLLPALREYVEAQSKHIPTTNSEFYALKDEVMRFSGQDSMNLLQKLQECAAMCARHFEATILNGETGKQSKIRIVVTNDSVCIVSPPSTYYVFGPRSISFSIVQDSCLLMCEDLVLILAPESVEKLMPLFAMTSVAPPKDEEKQSRFMEIAAAAGNIFQKSRCKLFESERPRVLISDLDKEIEKYQKGPSLFKTNHSPPRRAYRAKTSIHP